ncbi:MAG: hypothetical protein A4E34_01747 [Methanoregula sp. PtaU1.Bin006]|nr:MAG: hypothetical protein A4E33_01016 [Methanoregula sp. PtaB.Bin085]OPY33807.1 MAG: hypothetical protein A4E34_01747 [Methanoregula sp. PtaU1.Bin006]
MDVGRFVVESAYFTRATLFSKPSRWLVFILLGLPWAALSSLMESRQILDGNIIHWALVPWREAGLLIGAGVLCNLLVWGWIVRLFRKNPLPPEFDRPLSLCLDGIKAHTIPLVWILVPEILAFIQFTIAGSSTFSIILWPPDPATIQILVLLAVELVLFFYAVQYGLIGMIRFARTGSVREAFAILEIKRTFDRIGFVNYYLGFGVVVLSWLLFTFSLRGVALVPYAGPVIALCLGPVPVVFCSRFVAHFCDEDQYSPATGNTRDTGAGTVSLPDGTGSLATEYAVWLAILAVLVVLCFTPLALIITSVSRLIP